MERELVDQHQINLSYRSFETYYNTIVLNDRDYNIRSGILDDLSLYLGYENFKAYCAEWKTIEYTISQAVSKLVINIVNKPIFSLPQFTTRQAGMGFMGLIMATGLLANNYDGLSGQKLMYWDGDQYKVTTYKDKNPNHELVPLDQAKLDFFKKNKRRDTLTVENALGKTWYSKQNNEVDFFTMDGTNPDTGKDLRPVTPHILEKYAGVK